VNKSRLPFRLVYHDHYDLSLGDHVFPARKYRLIRDRLIADRVADPADFDTPPPIDDDDLLLVHDRGWIQRLKLGTLGYQEIVKLELPYSRRVVEGFWLAAGGTLMAARNALRDRVGFNIGGGFHHAFPAHGEGFCAVHDVAVAIRALQRDGAVRTAMVVDCDVHHGNGTAAIFAGDRTVSTISFHQFANYPSDKPPSSVDVHLADGTGDEEYLKRLNDVCSVAVPGFAPDILFYIAGADPYFEDQLGGLSLTMEGLRERDRVVLEAALGRGVPVVVTLAGGYALNTADTVEIHCGTVVEAARAAAHVRS
jgi:acetoin utilization deacetylase AcuC-like enzyme